MARTTKTKGIKGTSGGAAAAGGVGFQQEVAAYALAHVLVGDTALHAFPLDRNFDFRKLHLESADEVDDVILAGDGHRALIQAKTTVSLSDSPTSTYADVLRQFVAHHLRDLRPGDRYVLATSTGSSRHIVVDLTKLTEAVRLNAQALTDNPLTDAEQKVLEKSRTLILALFQEAGCLAPTDDDFLGLFSRIHVIQLEFQSPGGRDRGAALHLLRGRARIDSNLLWSALLELCGALMKSRGSIDVAGLANRLGHHVQHADRPKTLLDELAIKVVVPDNPAAGKDVVAFQMPGEIGTIMLTASERFDTDGSRTTRFTRDGFRYADGSVQPILCRAATPAGAMRYLQQHPGLIDGASLAVDQNRLEKSHESGTWAKTHRAHLVELFQDNPDKLRCVVCGIPVSENKALVVEIDDEDSTPAAGVAHQRCQYPALRVIGEVNSPLFSHFSSLRDFDFNGWMSALRKNGESILKTSDVRQVATMLWNGRTPGSPRGTSCVRIDADDGSSHYMSNRGKVLRFSESEAHAEVAHFQAMLEAGIAAQDPWCVKEDRTAFAQRSHLLKTSERGTLLLKCMRATVVPFNLAIDKAYSETREYYAPALLLVSPTAGNPWQLHDAVVMLTDPSRMPAFLENWKEAGFAVSDVAADVIDTDERFDRIVSQAFSQNLRVIVDPVFAPAEGLVTGIELRENR